MIDELEWKGVSVCLTVRTPAEARVILGEDAQAEERNADEQPVPSVALIRDGKRKPDPVMVRYMDRAVVIALSDRNPVVPHHGTRDRAGAHPRQ
ncbi:hypothetical protein [Streptomyces sp. NPDC006285]|uniref:hypothetical protein n=1 Tax=Streptomyces sp. NPDC006285 TaxID=3364742 RepID=UPI0036C2C0EA